MEYAEQAMAIIITTTGRTHALRQPLPMTQICDGVRNCHLPGSGCTCECTARTHTHSRAAATAAATTNYITAFTWLTLIVSTRLSETSFAIWKNPADAWKSFAWNVMSPVCVRATCSNERVCVCESVAEAHSQTQRGANGNELSERVHIAWQMINIIKFEIIIKFHFTITPTQQHPYRVQTQPHTHIQRPFVRHNFIEKISHAKWSAGRVRTI